MNFCSTSFIFAFLPVLVAVHGVCKGKLRNIVLLAGSIIFYILAIGGHYEWLVILAMLTVFNYLVGFAMSGLGLKDKKFALTVGVVINAGLLLFYKYAQATVSLATDLLPDVFSGAIDGQMLNFILPAGLSFYTFKNISYLQQVCTGKVEAEKSFLNYATYLVNFTQITMGPIQTYKDFRPYLSNREVTLERITDGLAEFIIGMGLKVIFANRLGSVWNGIQTIGYDGISTAFAWLGVVSFSLQLYFDFYGYTLMATGIGQMLGYETPKNFNYPYMARSMSEFWRRWHITLGDWFKENVYFPLGGNRCSKLLNIRNLFIVWMLTGIWHGDNLNFVVWGLFLFILIALEKTKVLRFITENKVLSHIYLIAMILISWTIFKITSLPDLAVFFGRLFPFFGETPEYVFAQDYVKHLRNVGWIIGVGIVFATPLPRKLYEKVKDKKFITVPVLTTIFWYAVYCAVCGANDPFLYFNF